jgi:hypothetical protein
MRSDIVVIAGIASQDSAQTGLAENDDMIQALAADRPDQRLGTDDGKYLKDRRKPAVKHDQDPAIRVRKPDAILEPVRRKTIN